MVSCPLLSSLPATQLRLRLVVYAECEIANPALRDVVRHSVIVPQKQRINALAAKLVTEFYDINTVQGRLERARFHHHAAHDSRCQADLGAAWRILHRAGSGGTAHERKATEHRIAKLCGKYGVDLQAVPSSPLACDHCISASGVCVRGQLFCERQTQTWSEDWRFTAGGG